MKTLIIFLLFALKWLSQASTTQTHPAEVLNSLLITSEDDLIAGLSRFMPNVVAIRNPQSVSEELPDHLEDLRMRLLMKGVKSNIFFCSNELPKDATDLYLYVVEAFCEPFDQPWKFLAVPYFENEEIAQLELTELDDALKSDNREIIQAYLLEKLQISRIVTAKTELEFFETFEEAAKSVINTYPKVVSVLQEEHVPSFINNVAEYGKTAVEVEGKQVNRDSYPVIFFSEEKVKHPPQLLQAFASFTSGLTNVGFVHNPKGSLLSQLGLPPEVLGKNTLLVFSVVNGQVGTYMYDKNIFGKFTAVSILGFFVNVVQGLKVPTLETSSFQLWQDTGANRLRLPIKYDLPGEEKQETNLGPLIEFQKSELSLQHQLSSKELKEECLNETTWCVLAVFDRFATDAEDQIATLSAVQDSFYEKTSLLGKERLLPFKVFFTWVDSVCNRDFVVNHLGISPTAVPTLASVFHSASGKVFSMNLVKAFNSENGVAFLKEQFQYRKLLTASEEDKQYKKYIHRFVAMEKSSLLELQLREECEEGGMAEEEDEDLSEMLKEIQEEERREREQREAEELEREKANEEKKKKKKKKKKKRKKKKEL